MVAEGAHATIRPMPVGHRPSAPLACLLSLALAAAACGPTVSPAPTGPASPGPTAAGSRPPAAPTGTGSPDPNVEATYRGINEQVQAIRGLAEQEPVTPNIVSPDELTEVLERAVREDTPDELLAAYEGLYQAMGLMPREDRLSDVYVELLASQVAGLYVPGSRELYVLSKEGEVGPIERVFYSHEYVHALQDQHFDLQAFQPPELADQSDRQMARQSVVEGDAYVAMTYWLQQHLTTAELEMFGAVSSDPEGLAALERIPPILSTQITFPALQGTFWVLRQQITGGWAAIDALYDDPPESTEQILHADKWDSREPPIDVQIPDTLAADLGAGWSLVLEDTFGEQQLGVWLTGQAPLSAFPPPPPEAAAGWGGDRVAYLTGPGGAWTVALKTEWDTATDATEFEAAVRDVLPDADGPADVLPGAGGPVRWVVIGSDDAVLAQVSGALGLAG